jgi:haemagglutination activity domain protein
MKNTLERFAGPHDFMSSWNYENINGITYLKDNGNLVNVASGLLLIPSVPFALVPFLQENFSNIEIYKDLKRQNRRMRQDAINKAYFK